SANGYNIQDIAGSAKPASAEQEYRLWYQYYFHTERGRAGLEANRREFCRFIWQLWSPNWRFDDATYDRTAVSFDNPDFVEVVIIPTVTVSATLAAIRAWRRSNDGWPLSRVFRYRRSYCMATAAASRPRKAPSSTPPALPALISVE